MKKTENLFICMGLLAGVALTGSMLWNFENKSSENNNYVFKANKYGAFLASQHAVYVNDFETANIYSAQITDTDLPIVKNTRILSSFLSGKMPESVADLKDAPGMPAALIYDTSLIQNNDWAAVWARHKSDESAITAPLRIWSGVAIGKTAEILKFIDKQDTNESWKSFVRGQIYAETGKIEMAAKQFAGVSLDFMNINDYLYLIAFYNHHNMTDALNKLRTDFSSRPGGMFMLDMDINPKWSDYSGLNNAFSFSLIQNISHTQVMMYSDISLLLLRAAEITQKTDGKTGDTLNYYLGQYFFNNGGDYKKYFNAIDKSSPFYPFSLLKIAEKSGSVRELELAVKSNPLFVPAATKLISTRVQAGDKKGALRIVNNALDNKNLSEMGRGFFLKARAQVYFTFGEMDSANTDIKSAAEILSADIGILAMQSRIWSAQNRELDTAYEYAIMLVQRNPTDIESWDVLGMAVWAREGAAAALELLERVGQVSNSCSVLFEHLGDLYNISGNKKMALDSYRRAIDLSEDGLTIISKLEKKIKALK